MLIGLIIGYPLELPQTPRKTLQNSQERYAGASSLWLWRACQYNVANRCDHSGCLRYLLDKMNVCPNKIAAAPKFLCFVCRLGQLLHDQASEGTRQLIMINELLLTDTTCPAVCREQRVVV